MLRASGQTADGRPLLVLGLSRVNCERLLKGQPIEHEHAAPGLNIGLVIIGGETEAEIADVLRELGAQPTQ